MSGLKHHYLTAPRAIAFWLVAALFAVTMLGTTLPAPLYVLYQGKWHFSSEILTVIYASYAAGVVAVLLLGGHASDQVGRKPVLATSLCLSALSTVAFIVASGLSWLFVGRILSGLSAGLTTGTATALLTELSGVGSTRRATMVATASNMGGLALGPILAGLFASYAPNPTVLVFAVYLIALAITALALTLVPETVGKRQKLSLRFSGLGIPKAGRDQFIAAGAAGFVVFSLLGLYTSLIPSFLARQLHQENHAVSGAVVGLVLGTAALAQIVLARLPNRAAMLMGIGLVRPGLALIVAALARASLPILLVGTVISGVACGAGFHGSLVMANRLAPAQMRAQVVSTYFAFCYAGLALPVVGVGVASQYFGDLRAVVGCSIVLALLCAYSLVVIRKGAGKT